MKLLATLLLVFIAPLAIAQTTLIVDHNFNAPTGPHIYSTIQAAVDAASPGDIIQVQPSPNAYGNVTINKQITLMGIGFNLTKDIPLQSTIGHIYLSNNVDNTSDASGTTITGLTFSWLYVGNLTGPTFTLSDVTVYNCVMSNVYSTTSYATVDNFQLYGNQINDYVSLSKQIYNSFIRNNVHRDYISIASSSPCSVTITNNIILGYINVTAPGSTVTILNNDFVGASTTTRSFATLYDIAVANNIFYGRTPAQNAAGTASASFVRNIFTNNLSYSTGNDALPPAGSNTGTGNLVAVSPDLTDVAVLSSWSSASDYSLLAGSAAELAGSDGTDIGITGGAFPWTDPNLILKTSAAPTIEILNTSTIINPGDNLPVRVKAQSN